MAQKVPAPRAKKKGVELNCRKKNKRKICQLAILFALMQMTGFAIAQDDFLGSYVVGSAGVGVSDYNDSVSKNDLRRNYGWSSAEVTHTALGQILTAPWGLSYIYPFMLDLFAFEGGLKNLGKVEATFTGTDANSGSVHGTEKSDPLAVYIAGVGRLPLGGKDLVLLVRGGLASTMTSVDGTVETLRGTTLVTETYSTFSTHTGLMHGFGIEKIIRGNDDTNASRKSYLEVGINVDYFDSGTKLGMIKTYMLTIGFPCC